MKIPFYAFVGGYFLFFALQYPGNLKEICGYSANNQI